MLTLTKQDSIVIAITLGLALGVPLAIPAFYTTSNITVEDGKAPPLPNSNPARHLAKRKVPVTMIWTPHGRDPRSRGCLQTTRQ